MDSKTKRRDRATKERQKAGLTYIYCMYCCKPKKKNELAISEGRYDVCRDEKCMEHYAKERISKLKQSKIDQRKRQLEENYPDPTWMTGDI